MRLSFLILISLFISPSLWAQNPTCNVANETTSGDVKSLCIDNGKAYSVGTQIGNQICTPKGHWQTYSGNEKIVYVDISDASSSYIDSKASVKADKTVLVRKNIRVILVTGPKVEKIEQREPTIYYNAK